MKRTSKIAGRAKARVSQKTGKKCPFPLIRGKTGHLMGNMDNETIAKLLEKEDLDRCRLLSGSERKPIKSPF